MNTYKVTWFSEGNIDKGTIIVMASCLTDAQDKFIDWIKKRPLYRHMWHLSFALEEVDYVEPEVIK